MRSVHDVPICSEPLTHQRLSAEVQGASAEGDLPLGATLRRLQEFGTSGFSSSGTGDYYADETYSDGGGTADATTREPGTDTGTSPGSPTYEYDYDYEIDGSEQSGTADAATDDANFSVEVPGIDDRHPSLPTDFDSSPCDLL